MYSFGKKSSDKLFAADTRLESICNEAIKVVDFTVLESVRSEDRQNYLFDAGLSKVEFPNSKHNQLPSLAIDVAPWPIDWKDSSRFYYLAGVMKATAISKGVNLRWGGDWDSDNDFKDQTFMDLGHFEIVGG